MATIRKVESNSKLQKLIKVAAYTRVSCDKDTMLHSLSTQVSYFSDLIQRNPAWIYVGVYSDEGITGTKANRPGFQAMINDAKQGKIDLILTKSISRFARNTVTLLETIRALKAIDVGVYFEEQNINTLSADGEFLLTVLGSYAQEESRSCSENCLWRVKRNFEEGILYGGSDTLGYKIVDKKFVVVPSEAKLVKRIFDLYINGLGAPKIGKILDKEGIKPKFTRTWCSATIIGMISNVNYTGDLLLQKSYRKDHISKSHMKNRGQKDMYLVSNDHEAIIDRTTFDKAQEIRKARASKFKTNGTREEVKNALKGKIRCAKCGSSYIRKKNAKGIIWVCSTYSQFGKEKCNARLITQDIIHKKLEEVSESKVSNDFIDKNLEYIEVLDGNKLSIKLIGKEAIEVEWQHTSRSKSWSKEMKEMARNRSIKQWQEKERN